MSGFIQSTSLFAREIGSKPWGFQRYVLTPPDPDKSGGSKNFRCAVARRAMDQIGSHQLAACCYRSARSGVRESCYESEGTVSKAARTGGTASDV